MPSRTIRPTQAAEQTPFPYTVGGTEGITPEAVFASWDGTTASGDFLPCVSYYDADGNLLDRAFPTNGPVSGGDTAEVSYRPFSRESVGASLAVVGDPDVVVPAKTLLFDGPPFTVHDLGSGEAEIGLSGLTVANASTSLTTVLGYTDGDPIPFLADTVANGVTAGTDSFTILTEGMYAFSALFVATVHGPIGSGQVLTGEISAAVPGGGPLAEVVRRSFALPSIGAGTAGFAFALNAIRPVYAIHTAFHPAVGDSFYCAAERGLAGTSMDVFGGMNDAFFGVALV